MIGPKLGRRWILEEVRSMTAGIPLSTLKHSTVLVLGILSLAVCLWPTLVAAQEVTATINGTITDPTGRLVANADVTATDLDRGTGWPARTNSEGFFNLTHLPVGRHFGPLTTL